MYSDGLEDYVRILKTEKIVVKNTGIELYAEGDFLNAVIRGSTTVEKLKARFPELEIVESNNSLRSLAREFESMSGE